ncbi:MAG: hypothetical protein LBH25_09880 [Fibromonadaceae bacterium]|nr:hypothetical protein [Fibromonadaceae bacterium]
MKNNLFLLATVFAAMVFTLSACSTNDPPPPAYVNCEVAGICTQAQTVQACQSSGGTVVASCPINGLINCDIGGVCTQTTSVACQASNGTVVASCPGGGGNSSSGGGSNNGNSSSGGGSDISSSSGVVAAFTLFCDYGYPMTEGGGCYPMNVGEINCDESWGI